MLLQPGGILAWIVVGIVSGWLAGVATRGRGFGILGDFLLGICGAVIGGFVGALIFPGVTAGIIGSILVAFIGAVVLLWLVRAIARPRRKVIL